MHHEQRIISRRQAVLWLMYVDVTSIVVLCRSFAIEFQQKCGASTFRVFINSAPATSKIRNWPQPQFTAGTNLHSSI
jgi:hypothetical protein